MVVYNMTRGKWTKHPVDLWDFVTIKCTKQKPTNEMSSQVAQKGHLMGFS